MAETRWLRELAGDDEVGLLFTATGDDLFRIMERVLELADRRTEVENRLIELLSLAVDQGIDDTYGSVWICLILGEIQSRPAIPVLLRALAGSDEPLQEAAVDALRRLGEPAFDAVMDALREEHSLDFELAAYRVLEGAALWEHPYLLEEVRDFLCERILSGSLPAPALEAAALTVARLGDRRVLDYLRKVLRDQFQDRNAALRDAVEMLEENESGLPLIADFVHWTDRVAWLLGEAFTFPEEEPPRPGKKKRGKARFDF